MAQKFDRQQFGRYQVVKLLGKGSMSTVYMAIDPRLGREVAIKVIHPQLSRQPGFYKRFEREAMALARLDHPNIISIYDMGEENDLSYMVIRFLSGGTLKDRLQALRKSRGFMQLPAVNYVLSPICDAVDYIHQAGFLHRDLKPSNIMFDDQDVPMVADFGIVKAPGWESYTSEGGILGTPYYMSPEQFSGSNVDKRTDIYSLGVILYEMCTSNLPYRGTVFSDIVKGHLYETPLPPQQINPSIRTSTAEVILRALAKPPDERYQSANQLAKAFSNTFPHAEVKDTLPISAIKDKTRRAYLRSESSGVRYKLRDSSVNRIGRAKPDQMVEVDLSAEEGSDFLHAVHVIINYTSKGWELAAPEKIQNPVHINDRKLNPGEKVILSNGDQITLSLTKLIIEISQ